MIYKCLAMTKPHKNKNKHKRSSFFNIITASVTAKAYTKKSKLCYREKKKEKKIHIVKMVFICQTLKFQSHGGARGVFFRVKQNVC